MSKKLSFWERLKRFFGPKTKTVLENSINRVIRDIDEIRKKTDSPANRIGLDEVKSTLVKIRDYDGKRNYTRDEIDGIFEKINSLLDGINGKKGYDDTVTSYVTLLKEYVDKLSRGIIDDEKYDQDIERIADINKEEVLRGKEDELQDELNSLYEQHVELSKKLEASKENYLNAGDAEVKSAKYEYNKSNRDLERLEILISSIERTLNITGKTRDNVIKHTINKEEALSIQDVTNRGVKEADYAESVTDVVNANKEAESNFAAIDDIDKTLGRDIHQSEDDDELAELERMRKQNQRDKAIAREDEESFGVSSGSADIKNG